MKRDEHIDDLVEGRVPERRATPRVSFRVPVRVEVMTEDEIREFENQDREILEQQPEDAIITTEDGEKVLRHERRGEPRVNLRRG